jgi:RNA polymerase sigma factor (sigma-70 family)
VEVAPNLNQVTTGAMGVSSQTEADSEFEIVFNAHYERVFAVLLRMLGEHTRAEELANEVFWKLYQQPRHELRVNLPGWLYRTATHVGIDALRASARRKQYEQAAGSQAQQMLPAGPLDELLRAEERKRVRHVLSSMKPAQAQILLLRASGFSYKELAETLQLAVAGVGTLLNRAEAEFRKRYMKVTGQKGEL